jgi:hypothetical protein
MRSELKSQMTVAMIDRLIDRVESLEKKIGFMSQNIFHLQNAVSKVNPGTLSGEQWMDSIPYDDRIENGGEY